MSTQTVIISGCSDCTSQEILVFIDALDKGCKENKKLCVLSGCFAWTEQILASVRCQRPVVMLARSVNAFKGLFVQQTDQIMFCCALFHNLHNKLVGITGTICT